MALAAGVCLIASLLLNVVPALDPTLGNRRFHVAIETAAGMVLVFIAAVLLGRFRRDSSRRTLLMFSAVAVLAFDNLLSAVISTTSAGVAGGFATWVTVGDGILGALLLAMAAVLPDRYVRRKGREVWHILGPTVVMLVATVVVAGILGDALPQAFYEVPADADELLLSKRPALVAAEAITALGYALAAIGFARLGERDGDEFLAWLGIGSVIAAVAFLDYALFPSQFTPLASGDLVFLAAITALLFGAVREIAHGEAVTVNEAVIEERRRVARDLHDGVAQELAFISAQLQWFQRDPTDREPLGLVMDAVDRAMDEARGAITALSRPVDQALDVAVGEAALDIATRIGARIELDLESGIEVPPTSRDALVRIVRESVGNAVRHGRARTIDLQLRDGGDGVRMLVADDGQGFDLDAPRSSASYGLTSMRERTESVGGSFRISSAEGTGTTVEIVLPEAPVRGGG